MLGIFKRSDATPGVIPFTTDVHSHVLWGIDDGAKTEEDSRNMLREFYVRGYRRIITTPHVDGEIYRDNQEEIPRRLTMLQPLLSDFPGLSVEAAAEYYLDEYTFQLVNDKKAHSFGGNYLLFELNFMNEPFQLNDFVFQAALAGYKPILAHPERYLYYQENFSRLEELLNRGVLLQVNLASFAGHYGKGALGLAQKLAEKGQIHLLGSDAHHLPHFKLIDQAIRNKWLQKALDLPLLNYQLS